MANVVPRVTIEKAHVFKDNAKKTELYFEYGEDIANTLLKLKNHNGNTISSSRALWVPNIDTTKPGRTPTKVLINSEPTYAGYDIDVIVLPKGVKPPPNPQCYKNHPYVTVENVRLEKIDGHTSDNINDYHYVVYSYLNGPIPHVFGFGKDTYPIPTDKILISRTLPPHNSPITTDTVGEWEFNLEEDVNNNPPTSYFLHKVVQNPEDIPDDTTRIRFKGAYLAPDGVYEVKVPYDKRSVGPEPYMQLEHVVAGATATPGTNIVLDITKSYDATKPIGYMTASFGSVFCRTVRYIQEPLSGTLPRLFMSEGKSHVASDGTVYTCEQASGDVFELDQWEGLDAEGNSISSDDMVVNPTDVPEAEGIYPFNITIPSIDPDFCLKVMVCIGVDSCGKMSKGNSDITPESNTDEKAQLLMEGQHYYGHHDNDNGDVRVEPKINVGTNCTSNTAIELPPLPAELSWLKPYEVMLPNIIHTTEEIIELQKYLCDRLVYLFGNGKTNELDMLFERMAAIQIIYSESLLSRFNTALGIPKWKSNLLLIVAKSSTFSSKALVKTVLPVRVLLAGAPSALIDFAVTYYDAQ